MCKCMCVLLVSRPARTMNWVLVLLSQHTDEDVPAFCFLSDYVACNLLLVCAVAHVCVCVDENGGLPHSVAAYPLELELARRFDIEYNTRVYALVRFS
eukprot:m.184184 g.184184  ORF g.184184 m.184184 type:complete len:98 (+) comp13595_c1_seq30:233-526(+)